MLLLFRTLLGNSVKAQSVFYALCSHRAIVSAENGVEWDTDKTSHADSLHLWALFHLNISEFVSSEQVATQRVARHYESIRHLAGEPQPSQVCVLFL